MHFDDIYKRFVSYLIKNKSGVFFAALLAGAAATRIYFYSGLVFSDDAYYDQLAYSLFRGDYGAGYQGYPGFLLRILNHAFTAVSFALFGANETASIIPSFIFSILTIPLIYKVSILFAVDKKAAYIAAFLAAFFPIDIVFATFNFAEPKCAFFLILSIYFLLKADGLDKTKYALLSGIALYVSLLLKEYAFFYAVFLSAAFIYFYFRGTVKKHILTSLASFSVLFILNSVYYLATVGDFFYYFTKIKENFDYSFYDFFPAFTARLTESSSFLEIKQIALNMRYIFLRRFYLGLPLLGLVLSIYSIIKGKNLKAGYFFLGLYAVFIFGTTSFSSYAPLNLHNSWNIYPLLLPLFIIVAVYSVKVKREVIYFLAVLYLLGGFYASYSYAAFFDSGNKRELKEFIGENESAEIYTDHHTKYGVDLIRGYDAERLAEPLNLDSLKNAPANSLIIYSDGVIGELKLQGYKYPDDPGLFEKYGFHIVKRFGTFDIYRKI